MAEDSLRTAIDAISSRLHEELEAQFAQLESRHQDELEAARRTAEADIERRWSAKVDEVRTEWTARLESEVSAARTEAERRMLAEAMRLRVEAEQAAAESAARMRQERDASLGEERNRADSLLESERQQLITERDRLQRESVEARQQLTAERDHLERELDDARRKLASLQQNVDGLNQERDRVESALRDERQAREDDAREQEQTAAAAAEARVAERQAQLAIVERILTAIRSLDAARSLSQVLSALLSSAAAEAPRVALFVVNGPELKGWKAEGFEEDAASLNVGADEDGLLADVVRRGESVVTSDGAGPTPPAFAKLPADRAAIAVPLLVGAQPVAVLYADDAGAAQPQAPASWPEAIQILCRHASVSLAHLTAARAADAMRRSLGPPIPSAAAGTLQGVPTEDSSSARRYARLLVSEIKLYNEPAVRLGRQQRDLLTRLKPEIDRARRLYEQRISSAVDSRGALFQQELVQTLADGDPALLGGST